MKGIVFTEFMAMVEEQYGDDFLDDVLDSCDLATKGAYTAVGTYDHREFLQILTAASRSAEIPLRELVLRYGLYLFGRFFEMMPHFFEGKETAFSFLSSVDNYIHVEVKKLYPDAQLPHFHIQQSSPDQLTMTYSSSCPFADFAEGLIMGCIAHYAEDIRIETEDVNTPENYGRIFRLAKHG